MPVVGRSGVVPDPMPVAQRHNGGVDSVKPRRECCGRTAAPYGTRARRIIEPLADSPVPDDTATRCHSHSQPAAC